ncbi:unnamed protein product, partial [Amoebophrya sp. A25]
ASSSATIDNSSEGGASSFLMGGVMQSVADAAAYTGEQIIKATFSPSMLIMAASFVLSALAHMG